MSSISLSIILLIAYSSIIQPPIVDPTQRVRTPSTPQPNIWIGFVSVMTEIDPFGECYVQGELQPNKQGAKVKVDFGLFNRSYVEGNATVTILEGEDVIISERYLLPPFPRFMANLVYEANKTLEASGLSCNIRSEVITVRLQVEPV